MNHNKGTYSKQHKNIILLDSKRFKIHEVTEVIQLSIKPRRHVGGILNLNRKWVKM